MDHIEKPEREKIYTDAFVTAFGSSVAGVEVHINYNASGYVISTSIDLV